MFNAGQCTRLGTVSQHDSGDFFEIERKSKSLSDFLRPFQGWRLLAVKYSIQIRTAALGPLGQFRHRQSLTLHLGYDCLDELFHDRPHQPVLLFDYHKCILMGTTLQVAGVLNMLANQTLPDLTDAGHPPQCSPAESNSRPSGCDPDALTN